MYPILLDIHSVMRWLIVIAGIFVLYRSGRGWFGRRAWTEDERRWGTIFTILLDIQLVLGLLLYFVFSPFTTSGFSQGMGDPVSRFFLVEHSSMMILAVIIAHVGSIMVKRAKLESKFKRMFIYYGIALLLILVAIPWPFSGAAARPWLF